MKKIFLSDEEKGWSIPKLAEKYGVSRATAWRAKKRGWLVPAYLEKKMIISDDGIPVSKEEIIRDAKTGVFGFLKRVLAGKNFKQAIAPFSTDDMVQEATKRLYELTGHEKFTDRSWRINVAWVAARDFIQGSVWKHGLVDRIPDKWELPEEPRIFGENSVFLAELRWRLGERRWELLWDWAKGSSNLKPPQDLIRAARKETGLCPS
ncbi:hypothetical protein A3B18_03805 [Candidatus Giovannonibacteria bacterium RIFCSPLOWO2_01_FULL_46_13]|uniref:Uncharacterized protein n=1 Tax=Candidatus Giovannonibacteria bacterium RIFCSPLOWO2_01_FULL_46_13 TaxID=1798352 RepID=A0A1F5X3G7_9BACT|nr:MAG: hypothetical protein A3B18_03805 [Candidatus Giovannonibacteria bacterium RIFCSPLOWO2_01_FULL_46_13]